MARNMRKHRGASNAERSACTIFFSSAPKCAASSGISTPQRNARNRTSYRIHIDDTLTTHHLSPYFAHSINQSRLGINHAARARASGGGSGKRLRRVSSRINRRHPQRADIGGSPLHHPGNERRHRITAAAGEKIDAESRRNHRKPSHQYLRGNTLFRQCWQIAHLSKQPSTSYPKHHGKPACGGRAAK